MARPWKGFQGLVLTAKRMPGKGICLEPASEALGEWRLPGGNFGAGFFSVDFARKTGFRPPKCLSGMAKWDSFILEGIAPTSGRKLSGQIMFCSQKVFSLRLDRIWRLNYNTTTVCNGTDRKEDACG